jgi:hypothetical protein
VDKQKHKNDLTKLKNPKTKHLKDATNDTILGK